MPISKYGKLRWCSRYPHPLAKPPTFSMVFTLSPYVWLLPQFILPSGPNTCKWKGAYAAAGDADVQSAAQGLAWCTMCCDNMCGWQHTSCDQPCPSVNQCGSISRPPYRPHEGLSHNMLVMPPQLTGLHRRRPSVVYPLYSHQNCQKPPQEAARPLVPVPMA
jgi:hypothetical protein